MRTFLLQWFFSSGDGWDTGEGVIGLYKTLKSAEEAGEAWLVEQDGDFYSYDITEMEVND